MHLIRQFKERSRQMSFSQAINEMVQPRAVQSPGKRPPEPRGLAFGQALADARGREPLAATEPGPEPRADVRSRPDRPEPAERPDRPDRPEHPHRTDRPDRPARPEHPHEARHGRPAAESTVEESAQDAVPGGRTAPSGDAASDTVADTPTRTGLPETEQAATLQPEVALAPIAVPLPKVAAAAVSGETPLQEQVEAVAAAELSNVTQQTVPVAAAAAATPAIPAGAGEATTADADAILDTAKGKEAPAGRPQLMMPEAAAPESGQAPGERPGKPPEGTLAAVVAQLQPAAMKSDQAAPTQASLSAVSAPDSMTPQVAALAQSTPQAQHLAAAAPQPPSRADSPVPMQALAVEIGMRAMRGAKEFQIRLDPEDLGRIDVRLEISEKGEVQARLMVERVETLQLLQRDARTLERAFDQAGLKTNPDALQFSLRDPGQQGGQQGRGFADDSRATGLKDSGADADPEPRSTITAIYRGSATGGLDIRI